MEEGTSLCLALDALLPTYVYICFHFHRAPEVVLYPEIKQISHGQSTHTDFFFSAETWVCFCVSNYGYRLSITKWSFLRYYIQVSLNIS